VQGTQNLASLAVASAAADPAHVVLSGVGSEGEEGTIKKTA
jgi:hypothetical protein